MTTTKSFHKETIDLLQNRTKLHIDYVHSAAYNKSFNRTYAVCETNHNATHIMYRK